MDLEPGLGMTWYIMVYSNEECGEGAERGSRENDRTRREVLIRLEKFEKGSQLRTVTRGFEERSLRTEGILITVTSSNWLVRVEIQEAIGKQTCCRNSVRYQPGFVLLRCKLWGWLRCQQRSLLIA